MYLAGRSFPKTFSTRFIICDFFSLIANTAAAISGLAWFLSYAPYLFMQQEYESMSLGQKIGASLAGNTAMAYGMQLMLMHEGTGAGIIFKYNIIMHEIKKNIKTILYFTYYPSS